MKKFFLLLLFSVLILTGCNKTSSQNKTIALFIPGIVEDSPVYAMLKNGVTAAVDKYNENSVNENKAELFVLEAGTNQSEWPAKITALVAQGKYDVIISSNPSLPEIVTPIIQQFPNQKFILLDAEYEGNKNIFTARYNQFEQAYITGYIGALMSKSHKLGLIAAQEYPVMNEIIYPYFEKGAKAADSDSTVDFRVVGNWYDASKGAVIADALFNSGVDVILPICGGASQGVISSAVNNNFYITWFDDNGFSKAPGNIISSTIMKQKELSELITTNYLNDEINWGQAIMVGIQDGYIDFVQDDPLYIKTVPENIRNKMSGLINILKEQGLQIN